MRRKRFPAVLLAVAALALLPPGLHATPAQDNPAAKVTRLLDSSGYAYAKDENNIWSLTFEGEALPKIGVVVFIQQDILVMFALVAEKKDLKVTPDLMQRLLAFNAELDRVKVGLDKDGDVFVRVDLSLRVVDGQEFKDNVDQVAAAADAVFKAIKPSAPAPK